MSSCEQVWEQYGVNPSVIGARHWGKYDKPFEFNVIVNNMADVQKHKDKPLTQAGTFSMRSSLGSGFDLRMPHNGRKHAKSV